MTTHTLATPANPATTHAGPPRLPARRTCGTCHLEKPYYIPRPHRRKPRLQPRPVMTRPAARRINGHRTTGRRTGTVYLLHFDRPYAHATNYTGWAANLDQRLAEHASGRGARLLAVAQVAGVGWTLARTWPGSSTRERALKNQGGASHRGAARSAAAARPTPAPPKGVTPPCPP